MHLYSFGEGSLRINDYYQALPRRHRRDRREQESPREVRVDLSHFHGKENVEACLDWEMRVEKLFASHKVKKERKIQKKREEDEREAKEKEKEKPSEGWCESTKNEEYLITPLTSILKMENQEKTLKEQKAWEKSVPSHKVLQQERKFENTFKNMLLVEQPSLTFCKGTLASIVTKEETLKEACIDKYVLVYFEYMRYHPQVKVFRPVDQDVFVRDLNRQLGTPSHWLPVNSCKKEDKEAP